MGNPWTRGPWRVDPCNRQDVQTSDGALEVTSEFDVDDAKVQWSPVGPFPSFEQSLANARLIAEAPAMAEALERVAVLIAAFHGSLGEQITDAELASLHNSTAKQVTAILARIKGETP
jgi:hypothetical protein